MVRSTDKELVVTVPAASVMTVAATSVVLVLGMTIRILLALLHIRQVSSTP